VSPPGRPRLLALDIDGTLLNSDREVSPRTRAAIHAARSAGVRLVLVTGRRLPSARRVAGSLGGDVAVIAHNGALVEEASRLLVSRPLDRAEARLAVEIGLAGGAEPVVHCGAGGEGRILVRQGARRSHHVLYYLERAAADLRQVSDLPTAVAAEEPMLVMFGGACREMALTRQALAGALGGRARVERSVYPAKDLEILEVLDARVTKSAAVAWLQSRWGIAPEQTLAIGDNWNDREMIRAAGIGYLMGNADPDLRRLGLSVLPCNDDDGVAVAIERHVLGNEKGGE
jgi:hydroxymethylpyrimidine pyrophosphatase-like HAD family hydrolase